MAQRRNTPDEKDVAEELERICRGFADAINRGDLSPASPAWSYMRPSFVAALDSPVPEINQGVSLAEYLAFMRRMGQINPDRRIDVSDISTYVNKRAGIAQVFANTKVRKHIFGDFSWQEMAVFCFTFSDDEGWRCVRLIVMRGMDGSESSAGGF